MIALSHSVIMTTTFIAIVHLLKCQKDTGFKNSKDCSSYKQAAVCREIAKRDQKHFCFAVTLSTFLCK